MKKIINILFAAILAITALSCQNKMENMEEYEAIAPEFSVETTFMSFSENETYKNIDITANCHWKATPRESWIKLMPAEGKGNGSMTVVLERNTSTAARTGTFTVTNGISTSEVAITQATSPFIPPTVGAVTTTVLSKNSASCTFYLKSTDFVVSAHGVCYSSKEKEPVIGNSTKTVGEGMNTGEATFLLNDLMPNTTYYIRGYATTNRGTTYGSITSFTTPKTNAPGNDDNPQPTY